MDEQWNRGNKRQYFLINNKVCSIQGIYIILTVKTVTNFDYNLTWESLSNKVWFRELDLLSLT